MSAPFHGLRRRPRHGRLARLGLLAALAAGAALASAPLTAAPAGADVVRDAQWHIDDLRLPAAWQISRGKGVTIAILDTGVDPRSDSVRGRVKTGPDYVKSGAKRGDQFWGRHGTDIATVAAGAGRRPGAPNGVLGVAPEARVLSVRVIAEDEDPEFGDAGSVDGVARAIRYAADNGAGVINMSFGAGDRDDVPGERDERAAVRYALSKGVVVVASAGNDGDPNSRQRKGRNRVGYPAGYAGVIAVGASRRQHTPAAFSTKHGYVTIAAPGVDIIDRADASFYYLGSGTSQAAAVVSGTVALIKAKYPELSPAQIRQLLVDTASHRPKGGYSAGLGFGIVNPLGALRQAAKVSPADGPQQAPAPVRPPDKQYFGAGPERPAPSRGAARGGILPGGTARRVLLGVLGVAFLLPAPWLLIGGARSVAEARRRRAAATTAALGPPVPGWPGAWPNGGHAPPPRASSTPWTPPRPPEYRNADQRAEYQRDQQGQPQWHQDHRHQHADAGRLPILEHEHQRDDRQDQHKHLPPPEGAAAP